MHGLRVRFVPVLRDSFPFWQHHYGVGEGIGFPLHHMFVKPFTIDFQLSFRFVPLFQAD